MDMFDQTSLEDLMRSYAAEQQIIALFKPATTPLQEKKNLSKHLNTELMKHYPADMVMFGEIGLSGEIRPVQNGLERLNEAEKHGFKQALIPLANNPKEVSSEMNVQTVSHLSQVMDKVGL